MLNESTHWFTHFPSIGSDAPPHLGVKNVKIQENSEGPSTTIFRPLKKIVKDLSILQYDVIFCHQIF